MPWRLQTPMSERRQFVEEYLRRLTSMTALCACYGISRRVGYKWLARYEEGVQLYRQKEFTTAAKMFEQSLQRQPQDQLSAMYLARCQELIANPPAADWDGVFKMTKK